MHVAAFEVMLSHANLLRGRLDTEAVQKIFQGIQEEEDHPDPDSESEEAVHESDSSEISDVSAGDDESEEGEVYESNANIQFSYPEFTDALIAVVLYHDPNPFITFALRFERFLREKLLKPLQKHWIANTPDGGLGKTLRELLGEREREHHTSPTSKSRRMSSNKFSSHAGGFDRGKAPGVRRIREGNEGP